MRTGTRRLLALTVALPGRAVVDRLGNAGRLALAAAPHDSHAAVVQDATDATLDALVAAAGGPAWDEEAFARLRDRVAGELSEARSPRCASWSRSSTRPPRCDAGWPR